jgi:hypothetical protein
MRLPGIVTLVFRAEDGAGNFALEETTVGSPMFREDLLFSSGDLLELLRSWKAAEPFSSTAENPVSGAFFGTSLLWYGVQDR